MRVPGPFLFLVIVLGASIGVAGCTRSDAEPTAGERLIAPSDTPAMPAPAGLVDVDLGGETIRFWPYTGNGFDGTPVDPVNLVFVGEADPVQIRSALLSLDGNRPGLPPGFPFDATWSEAIGDAQTTFGGEAGWTGSVVQLQMGTYDPIRFHLRLFRLGELADGRTVTLGAAHFEVLIPGTTDHQVLSWEMARDLAVYDIARTGLLAASPESSGPINQTPTYRDIPDVIYNLLPAELIAVLGGPPQPVAAPVLLPSDGEATVLVLGAALAGPSGPLEQRLALVFDQVIPRPFCLEGPYDWVHVGGEVELTRVGEVDGFGRYEYNARYSGQLLVTPVDITANPPVPVGEPFAARVQGTQSGYAEGGRFRLQAHDQRLSPVDRGMEFQDVMLQVGSSGRNEFRVRERCVEP